MSKDKSALYVVAVQLCATSAMRFTQRSRYAFPGHLLSAASRAGSNGVGGMAQNEVPRSSAATMSSGHKTIVTSSAVGCTVTHRPQFKVASSGASGPVVPKLSGPMPNFSLKLSPNGEPPGPRYSAGVHYLQRGPGVSPSVPA